MLRDGLRFRDGFRPNMNRQRSWEDGFRLKGQFYAEHVRNGIIIAKIPFPNAIVNEAKNLVFDTMFNSASQFATWYFGLINNASFSLIAAGDVMNSHGGWAEWTDYDESVRQTFTHGAAASQGISSSSVSTFTISADGTLQGGFLCSNSAKNGTTGKLWSAGTFPGPVDVLDNDQIRLNYAASA